MKRLYIAFVMVILCISAGIFESVSITNSFNKYLDNIKKVDTYVENKKYHKALNLCKHTADEYEKLTTNLIYCYYPHTTLENIGINLWVMTENLKNRDINKYNSLKEQTKKQLLAIKEEELFTIQNIL